jgi:hypothetical protein
MGSTLAFLLLACGVKAKAKASNMTCMRQLRWRAGHTVRCIVGCHAAHRHWHAAYTLLSDHVVVSKCDFWSFPAGIMKTCQRGCWSMQLMLNPWT